MLPASSKGGGQVFVMPDVCKISTPAGPVPTPFPNFGMVMQVVKFAVKLKLAGKNAVSKKSEMPRSQGDEPGMLGGVVSNQNMAKVAYTMGSTKVKFEGQPAQYLTAPTRHNGANANAPSGMQIVPSQFKVFVAS